jgi:hypothetical protein
MANATLIRHNIAQASPMPVLRRLVDHLLAVLLLLMSAFRTSSPLSELKDLTHRTRIANFCWDFFKARDLVRHLNRLVLTKTSTCGLASHPSLMLPNHVHLRLLV